MISVFIFGIMLGLIQFFRTPTFANMYSCVSISGSDASDHINNDLIDNQFAVFSFVVLGLVALAVYDANFSFSLQYFGSKLSFIVEEPVVRNSSIFENTNAAGLLAGIVAGESARILYDKYKEPFLDLYYGRFEPTRPRTARDIRNKSVADICCLVMDIDARTLKMVEIAVGTEFQLNPIEREFIAGRMQQQYNTVGSVSSILRPINKMYGRNSAGGRAFFDHLVRICVASGFRNERTESRLQMVANSLGISQIEAMAAFLRLNFTVDRGQQQTHSGYQQSRQQHSNAQNTQCYAGSQRNQYLALLGLSASASDKQIKSAYRKFAKKYHPDILQSQNLSPAEMEEASAKMAQINMAYEWLTGG